MAKIVVVYYSGSGHTQRMAQAVAAGAKAVLIAIDGEGHLGEQDWAELHAADAIIFGTPTYMGGVSGQFKKFADQSAKYWFNQAWKNKLFAGFTNSTTGQGNKINTLLYLQTLAMQHGGLWVGTGTMPTTAKSAMANDMSWIGAFAGIMAQSPSDAAAPEVLLGDLELAKQFGYRVESMAQRWAVRPVPMHETAL